MKKFIISAFVFTSLLSIAQAADRDFVPSSWDFFETGGGIADDRT